MLVLGQSVNINLRSKKIDIFLIPVLKILQIQKQFPIISHLSSQITVVEEIGS